MSYRLEFIRTSMSLDTGTISALKKIAQIWGVSKAEVMRRAVKKVEMEENQKLTNPAPSPLEALAWLQNGGGLSHAEGSMLREEMSVERQATRYWWEE
jgi:hypothetical protein